MQKVDGQLVLHQNKVDWWTSCVGCLSFPLKNYCVVNHQHMHYLMVIVVVNPVQLAMDVDGMQTECQFLLPSDVKWFRKSVKSLRVVVSCVAEGCGGDGLGDVLTSRLKSAAEPTLTTITPCCLPEK